MDKKDLLIEIGTKELPAKSLSNLSKKLLTNIVKNLNDLGFNVNEFKNFYTPRRLIFFIANVPTALDDFSVEKKGPLKNIAIDADGNLTNAGKGFYQGFIGKLPKKIEFKNINSQEYIYAKKSIKGHKLTSVLSDVLSRSLADINIKKMIWDKNIDSFLRPIHWITVLHGDNVLKAKIFGINSSNYTKGHRVYCKKNIIVKSANINDYLALLKTDGYVIANQAERKQLILEQLDKVAKSINCKPVISQSLLNEVLNLVEFPKVYLGSFSKDYLEMPKEVLLASMESHQRCFGMKDNNSNLSNYFLIVSNINPEDPSNVISGNEKVINARLRDALFLYKKDCNTSLHNLSMNLRGISVHEYLGNMHNKQERVKKIANHLIHHLKLSINNNIKEVNNVLDISKADLLSQMVMEFPELQGIMGHHYAIKQSYDPKLAAAIEEQYYPNSENEKLPATELGIVLNIADRIDNLVSYFAIKKFPTGDKDPFALRRNAITIIKIIIKYHNLGFTNIDLLSLIQNVSEILIEDVGYHGNPKKVSYCLENECQRKLLEFFLERMKNILIAEEISTNIVNAAFLPNDFKVYNIHKRAHALASFRNSQSMTNLLHLYKRVSNILNKNCKAEDIDNKNVEDFQVFPEFFRVEAENVFLKQSEQILTCVNLMNEQGNYVDAISELLNINKPLSDLFESTMILSDDAHEKRNRINMLCRVYTTMQKIANFNALV